MALVTRSHPAFRALGCCRGLVVLAASLTLGACAQSPGSGLSDTLTLNSKSDTPAAQTADQATAEAEAVDTSGEELKKATEYWGNQYAKNPRDLQPALNYARNLKAMGEKQRALAVLQQISMFHGQSRELAGEYGRLALELDQIGVANRLLAAADDPSRPDWRIISGRGTVLAKQGKYADAIPYFERALSLAHNHPSVLSNLALAHAMNGEPGRAETMLRQAATTDRRSLKIRQNLALVLGLQGKYAEAKLLASRDMPAESAADNTEYLRRIVKLEPNAPPTISRTSKGTQVARETPKPAAAGAAPQVTGTIVKGGTDSEPAPGLTSSASEDAPHEAAPPEATPDSQATLNIAQSMPAHASGSASPIRLAPARD